MSSIDLKNIISEIVDISHDAGETILEVYHSNYDVEMKGDGSPLTTADMRSHNLICERLQELTPDIPILSEESVGIDYKERAQWNAFWLVDPLDGTKEFVKRSGEFTVNIALMVNNQPVLGVVHTPYKDWTHYAFQNGGAFKQIADEVPEEITAETYAGGKATVVASRSHGQAKVEQFMQALKQKEGEYDVTNMGSALKMCLIAEGQGDIYPRLGLTSEWDTAAAHIVLNEAGGKIIDTDGEVLEYNKENILNPFFLAIGKGDYPWLDLLDGINTTPE